MCRILEEVAEENLEKGRKETMLDTAKRMLSFGKYTLDEIADISGLSLEEIRQLQKA